MHSSPSSKLTGRERAQHVDHGEHVGDARHAAMVDGSAASKLAAMSLRAEFLARPGDLALSLWPPARAASARVVGLVHGRPCGAPAARRCLSRLGAALPRTPGAVIREPRPSAGSRRTQRLLGLVEVDLGVGAGMPRRGAARRPACGASARATSIAPAARPGRRPGVPCRRAPARSDARGETLQIPSGSCTRASPIATSETSGSWCGRTELPFHAGHDHHARLAGVHRAVGVTISTCRLCTLGSDMISSRWAPPRRSVLRLGRRGGCSAASPP